ncbi:hypothetical protein LJB42_001752 [Komagataella kurtzmanii]|nr:hypothetical protein LJB42_001752 [Komagataella kurtzmanii]
MSNSQESLNRHSEFEEPLTTIKRKHSGSTASVQSFKKMNPDTAATSLVNFSEEDQVLASKLQDTYKNIIKLENTCQSKFVLLKSKMEQQKNMSPEINDEAWHLYEQVIKLLDMYYDFLFYALSPSQLADDGSIENKSPEYINRSTKTGEQIVLIYKIPRRMWVYGIVNFLEILKTAYINSLVDYEISGCFTSYCFNILACLTELSSDMTAWWIEKLADLSRMAIALYPSRFIDWKLASEYWYVRAIKLQYGHGKVYYHMCTVQEDSLDALINIGKALLCRDTFQPSLYYLSMILENIRKKRDVSLSTTLEDLTISDFVKIHKFFLESIDASIEMYVSHFAQTYAISKPDGYDFFKDTPVFAPYAEDLLVNEHIIFWFQKSGGMAICNINQLIGFGNPRNPFAKLFGLPEAFISKREKKDKRKRSKSTTMDEDNSSINSESDAVITSREITDTDNWLNYFDKYLMSGSIELSNTIIKDFTTGPFACGQPHVIVWLYFLISVNKALQDFENSYLNGTVSSDGISMDDEDDDANFDSVEEELRGADQIPYSNSRYKEEVNRTKTLFEYFIFKIIPWDELVRYLNTSLDIARQTMELPQLFSTSIDEYGPMFSSFSDLQENLNAVSQGLETLPEAWKLWGLIWYDFLDVKTTYTPLSPAPVSEKVFDHPVNGPIFSHEDERIRLLRIVALATYLSDLPGSGLIREGGSFYTAPPSTYWTNYEQEMREKGYFKSFFNESTQEFCNIAATSLETIRPEKLQGSDNNKWWLPVRTEKIISAYEDARDEGRLWNMRFKVWKDKRKIISRIELSTAGEDADIELTSGEINDYDDLMNTMQVPAQVSALQGDLGECMDSAVTMITLDTNMWLKHCGMIYKSVESRVINVSIPLTVFQELRSLRASRELAISDSAIRAVITIRQLFAENLIVPLKFDGSPADLNDISDFQKLETWRENADELIIGSVKLNDELRRNIIYTSRPTLNGINGTLSEAEYYQYRYNTLITDDRNMRLRGRANGIMAFQSLWLTFHLKRIADGRCIC